MVEEDNPHVVLKTTTKKQLDKIKSHPRETYDQVIVRLCNVYEDYINYDEELKK